MQNTTQAVAFRESEGWKKGEEGQGIISDFLNVKNGWFLINNADFCGRNGDKAPRLHGLRNSYVTPDLLIAKDGQTLWLEVKTKETYTLHELTGREEHGFSLRHYRDYVKVEDLTGIAVWIGVYELASGELLFGRLSELARHKRIYPGDKMDIGGTIFFLREDFQPYHLTGLSKINPKKGLKAAARCAIFCLMKVAVYGGLSDGCSSDMG